MINRNDILLRLFNEVANASDRRNNKNNIGNIQYNV